jgi:6-phosphogluconate dehydrogenase (decarboxylating)
MEHAKDFEEGYEMLGQDGHVHIVKVAKNGVKRWAHAN